MDNFLLINFKAHRKYDDFIQSTIYNFDIIGFEIDDPIEKMELIKNLPEWEVSDLVFDDLDTISYGVYFSDDEKGIKQSKNLLDNLFQKIKNLQYESKIIDNSNWEEEWKKSYTSFTIGEKILVKPSWEDVNTNREYVIEIDPKMAFGTGTHETTSLCMEYVENMNFKDKSILDIGCGTGILSILSSKLGALEVDACDIDELAIESTKENSEINNVKNVKSFYSNLFSDTQGEYDIIFANILAEILVEMLKDAKNYLTDNGKIIMSGIVEGREKIVEEAIEKYGFKLIDKIKKNEWYLLVVEKINV